MKQGNYVPSDSNESTFVASHTSTSGNSIEQESEIALGYLLKEVSEYFDRLILYVKRNATNYPYLVNIREAGFKLHRVIEAFELEEKPNWYKLYEGLCGSHLMQREQLRQVRSENQHLRQQCKEWKKKFNDACDRLNSTPTDAVSDTTEAK